MDEATQGGLVARGEREILAAARALRRARSLARAERRHALAAQLRSEPPPLPAGPFRVIVADPPWRYRTRLDDHELLGLADYPDMTPEEIAALPVPQLATRDAIVWLWATNAFMHESFHVLEAWGFEPKTILTWDKERLGLGHWLRNATEHCILAVRGRPLVELGSQCTLLRECRREHSRKPEAFYGLVECLCPGSKLELFARQARPGWTAWGLERDRFGDAGGATPAQDVS